MNDLVFQREADGNVPAGIVTIDLRWAGSAVQIGMDQADSREGNEVDAIIQPEMVFPDSRKGDLEKIARRADLHHGAEGKVAIGVVVDIESEREDGSIDCAGREPEVRSESPPVFIRPCRHRGEQGPEQDGQRHCFDRRDCSEAKERLCAHERTIA